MKTDKRTKYHALACAVIELITFIVWLIFPSLADKSYYAALLGIVPSVLISMAWEGYREYKYDIKGDKWDVYWGVILGTMPTGVILCIIYNIFW